MTKTISIFLRLIVLVALIVGLGLQAFPGQTAPSATTFTVDTTSDTPDANLTDGACADSAGKCSLRAAIQQFASVGGDKMIEFDIPGDIPFLDRVLPINSALPTINYPLTIQGPNKTGGASIVMDGGGKSYSALFIDADDCKIHKLTIRNFDGTAIYVRNASGTVITGNKIGPFGLFANGNLGGIILYDSTSSFIGGQDPGTGNIISGNTQWGIIIRGGGTNNVWGNIIGLNVDGTSALANGIGGIAIDSSTSGASIGNTIGGTTAGRRNVISGHSTWDGVSIGDTRGNFILGNYIGVSADGTTAIPNKFGISFRDSGNESNTVGGTLIGAGNLISGNSDAGIYMEAGTGNLFQGNTIGLDVSQTTAIPNGNGIDFRGGASNTIGGTQAGAGNVIAGNGYGIYLFNYSNGPLIQGNWIGVNQLGAALPNQYDGIDIWQVRNTQVGGVAAGAGNVIAHNSRNGVNVNGSGSLGNTIVGNSIHSNGWLGINLGATSDDGVTPNDPKDTDSGANTLQNFPVLIKVSYSAGNTLTVYGRLNSSLSRTFSIHLYGNHNCDSSGHGEGLVYLGTTTVDTDTSGDGSFSAGPFSVPSPYLFVTATATDPDGNTSEFSMCRAPYAVYLPMLIR